MGAATAAALLLMAAAVLPLGQSGGLAGADERGSCADDGASELRGATWQLHGGPPPPWPPLAMTPRVVAASVAALAGGTLSSAVGAGRAGLFVPIFSLLLGFRLRTSAALSQVMAKQTYTLANGIRKVEIRLDYGYWPFVLFLLVVWSSFLTLQLLQVYASEASLRSWTLTALQVLITVAATLVSMLRRQKRATFVPTGDAQWGWKELLSVPLCGLPAGCLGAMLGLGGAIIIRPTLLQAHVNSQVCSATMGLLILLSSTLALVEYAILGQLPMDYAAYFLGLSFIAAMLGMLAGRWVLARSGLLPAATFMLAAIISAGAVVIGSTSGLRQEETMSCRNPYRNTQKNAVMRRLACLSN
eukprot:SM000028S10182  [mRNA]  locus=s28:777959:781231:+ [translate_table: standard]